MHTSIRRGTALVVAFASALLSLHLSAAPLLNGVAVHTELGKEQFIGGLYSDTLSTDARTLLTADVNKRVQVRVLADVLSSRRFKRMWIEGIAINSSHGDLQDNAQNMADFSNMLRAKLVEGDILTIERSLNDGVVVVLNGAELGRIADRNFFDLLLRTWIGPVPLSSGFRDNLLGNGEVSDSLLARYEATRPSDERIAAVERAVAAAKRERVEQAAEKNPDALAMDDSPKQKIEAPKLEAPDLAMVPPSLGAPTPPAVSAPKPELAQPKPEATAQPPREQPKAPAETPKPAQQQAKAKPQPSPAEEAVFEDDDEEEAFTAASLLSQQLYIGKVKSWAQKELKYPDRALRRQWEGSVRLDITLSRKGELISVDVAEEASHNILTKEALRAVEKAAPFPSMPDDVRGDTFLFTLPIAFKLGN